MGPNTQRPLAEAARLAYNPGGYCGGWWVDLDLVAIGFYCAGTLSLASSERELSFPRTSIDETEYVYV